MSEATLGVDLYQLTTLAAHADAGRLGQRVAMAFFFRRLPPHRRYVLFCGLRAILEHAAQMGLDEGEIATLLAHPTLGPALRARPQVIEALRAIRGFEGEIDALPEGTPAFAGPGFREDGAPLVIAGARVILYTPLVEVRTDLVRAKLIETPWLGWINHQSMIASKAARIVEAAAGLPISEFGSRRTDPGAALSAAYAAHLAGCDSTSNVAAHRRFGIPAAGTMDHFAVQAAERDGVPTGETERALFAGFAAAFPDAALLLVDTYDTERGIGNAVAATAGRLHGIRLDSDVTPESVRRARALLDALGAPGARIFCSDQLDEHRVAALAATGCVDGFGVGENLSTSPDAASGIGAVAKLVENGYGKRTMKLSRGSGKATLPGPLQVHRFADHDRIALADEAAPAGATPLLRPAWRGRSALPQPTLAESRDHARQAIASLPPSLRAFDERPFEPRRLVASDALAREIERLTAEAVPT